MTASLTSRQHYTTDSTEKIAPLLLKVTENDQDHRSNPCQRLHPLQCVPGLQFGFVGNALSYINSQIHPLCMCHCALFHKVDFEMKKGLDCTLILDAAR